MVAIALCNPPVAAVAAHQLRLKTNTAPMEKVSALIDRQVDGIPIGVGV